MSFENGQKLLVTKEQMNKLRYAARVFSTLCEGNVHAKVKETWADYGAGLYYDQVIIYRDEAETDSFQISPNDREAIIRATHASDIIHVVMQCMGRYPSLYKERR